MTFQQKGSAGTAAGAAVEDDVTAAKDTISGGGASKVRSLDAWLGGEQRVLEAHRQRMNDSRRKMMASPHLLGPKLLFAVPVTPVGPTAATNSAAVRKLPPWMKPRQSWCAVPANHAWNMPGAPATCL